jgi:hypothetical protein
LQFAILVESTKLFEKHEHKYTAKDHHNDSSFCACPQIYQVPLLYRVPNGRKNSALLAN